MYKWQNTCKSRESHLTEYIQEELEWSSVHLWACGCGHVGMWVQAHDNPLRVVKPQFGSEPLNRSAELWTEPFLNRTDRTGSVRFGSEGGISRTDAEPVQTGSEPIWNQVKNALRYSQNRTFLDVSQQIHLYATAYYSCFALMEDIGWILGGLQIINGSLNGSEPVLPI